MRMNLVKRKRTAQKPAATAVEEGRGTARKQHKIWKAKRHSVKGKYCTVNEARGENCGFCVENHVDDVEKGRFFGEMLLEGGWDSRRLRRAEKHNDVM